MLVAVVLSSEIETLAEVFTDRATLLVLEFSTKRELTAAGVGCKLFGFGLR